MKRIARSEVSPGRTFGFIENRLFCVALDDSLDEMMKRRFWGGAGKAWHVYLPKGQVSWTENDSLVFVEDASE